MTTRDQVRRAVGSERTDTTRGLATDPSPSLPERLLSAREQERTLRRLGLSEAGRRMLSNYSFLTLKPLLVVLNVPEGEVAKPAPSEVVAAAEERGLVLMPGHLLLYHPGVAKLKELVDSGELGDCLYVYGNRQNLGKIRRDENVLWSLGAHDLSVILDLVGEEPEEASARGESFLTKGVEDIVFCYLRFPSGVVAHLHLSWLDPHKMRKITVVGDRKMAVFDDMELDHKVTIYDKGPQEPVHSYGEWMTRSGDIWSPKIPNDEPLRLECARFLDFVRGEADSAPARENGLAVVRVLEELQRSLERERV